MPMYTIQVVQTTEFVVEIEAETQGDAIDLVHGFDNDELDEYETDVRWAYEVVEGAI